MMPSSSTLTKALNASLVKEQVTDLVLLAVLAMQKERDGEEQSTAVLHCLSEWSAVAKAYLKASGYAAADRSAGRIAVAAFLEREGQRDTSDLAAAFSNKVFAFGAHLARQQAAELEHCLFCGSPVAILADLPYCSPECSESARRS